MDGCCQTWQLLARYLKIGHILESLANSQGVLHGDWGLPEGSALGWIKIVQIKWLFVLDV